MTEQTINLGHVVGRDGLNGRDGTDGFSPVVNTESVEGGTKVIITDKNGEKSFTVMNGTDGKDGPPGADGAPGRDGQDGTPGTDGKSAYQAAAEKGYTGTETEFNEALAGMQNAPFLPTQIGSEGEKVHVGGGLTIGTDGENAYISVSDTGAVTIVSMGASGPGEESATQAAQVMISPQSVMLAAMASGVDMVSMSIEGGAIRFTGSVLTPDPASAMQAANKNYVDITVEAAISGAIEGAY